jgi:cytokinin dehydrogenase
VDERNLTVDGEPGVVWRDLTHHLKKWNLVPPVLTNNLGVTVAGTLSMAGIGVASFKYGSQGDNVAELDVVTGEGKVVTCSPENNEELFWGAIAGLGSFGIITRARLKLRPMKSMTRTYYLLYDDLRVFLDDARTAMDSGRWDHLESWGAPCAQGTRPVAGKRQVFAKWFYPFHLTVEYEPDRPPDDKALLSGLSPYDNLYTDDCPTIDFLERMVPVFELWRKAGTWEFMHPWIECILPWETAADCIEQVLADTPPGIQVGGHVLLWPAKGKTSRSKNFMVPAGENLVGFGLLPAVPQKFWGEMSERLENVSRMMLLFGAKRYLSGWVNFTPDWRARSPTLSWIESRLRETGHEAPVLMMSANIGDKAGKSDRPLDHDSALSKPVDLHTMLGRIETMLKLEFITASNTSEGTVTPKPPPSADRLGSRHVEEPPYCRIAHRRGGIGLPV